MTTSGGCAAACCRASVPSAATPYVVVPGAQVDAEGPQELRFVVDDEDAGHDAACGALASAWRGRAGVRSR